eukprot:CAMPEP_0178995732 /NCGR_PEP_ID=MMETSP0795-20121207/7975_1 /TAXON_ID=88552 /ORGANISM="Amoebophrya sp., Strain Ameob2" /LENGTH=717 /DNA_ID=CAMNT_0020688041 /DNA_START=348 /DNA_END=2501 /DNA_ORIENTATION=+
MVASQLGDNARLFALLQPAANGSAACGLPCMMSSFISSDENGNPVLDKKIPIPLPPAGAFPLGPALYLSTTSASTSGGEQGEEGKKYNYPMLADSYMGEQMHMHMQSACAAAASAGASASVVSTSTVTSELMLRAPPGGQQTAAQQPPLPPLLPPYYNSFSSMPSAPSDMVGPPSFEEEYNPPCSQQAVPSDPASNEQHAPATTAVAPLLSISQPPTTTASRAPQGSPVPLGCRPPQGSPTSPRMMLMNNEHKMGTMSADIVDQIVAEKARFEEDFLRQLFSKTCAHLGSAAGSSSTTSLCSAGGEPVQDQDALLFAGTTGYPGGCGSAGSFGSDEESELQRYGYQVFYEQAPFAENQMQLLRPVPQEAVVSPTCREFQFPHAAPTASATNRCATPSPRTNNSPTASTNLFLCQYVKSTDSAFFGSAAGMQAQEIVKAHHAQEQVGERLALTSEAATTCGAAAGRATEKKNIPWVPTREEAGVPKAAIPWVPTREEVLGAAATQCTTLAKKTSSWPRLLQLGDEIAAYCSRPEENSESEEQQETESEEQQETKSDEQEKQDQEEEKEQQSGARRKFPSLSLSPALMWEVVSSLGKRTLSPSSTNDENEDGRASPSSDISSAANTTSSSPIIFEEFCEVPLFWQLDDVQDDVRDDVEESGYVLLPEVEDEDAEASDDEGFHVIDDEFEFVSSSEGNSIGTKPVSEEDAEWCVLEKRWM